MTGRRKNRGRQDCFYAKGLYNGEKFAENFRGHREYPAFFRVAQPTASRWSRETYALPGGLGLRELLFRRKDMRENTSVHRLLRRALSLCLAVVLAVSLCVPALAAQTTRRTAAWRALPPTPRSSPCRCSAVSDLHRPGFLRLPDRRGRCGSRNPHPGDLSGFLRRKRAAADELPLRL